MLLIPSLALLALYVAKFDHSTTRVTPLEVHGLFGFVAYKTYTLMKLGLYQNFMVGRVGDYERSRLLYVLGCALNAALAFLFAMPALAGAVTQRRLNPEKLSIAVCILFFLVVAPPILLGVLNTG